MRGLCRRLLPDEDADDVAQDALLKVFERASEFDPTIGAARPWMLGIATWEVRTLRRRRGRELARARPQPEPGSTPEDDVLDANLKQRLDEILADLDELDRATVLAVLEREERPAVTPATFRKRVQRATERLRQAWRRAHG